MPKISFVIPVYNAEKSLRKCVESIVFGQEKDIELLLVEDCSTDGSLAVCHTLAQEFPQVKCLHNETNRGVSYTRNHGLRNAAGKYVLFVDSDDFVCSSYAKQLTDTYEANPRKLVLCGYRFLDYTTYNHRTYGIIDGGEPMRTVSCRDYFSLADEVLLLQLWNKAFDLQIIRNADIRFDETTSMGEDFQFVLDYLKAADHRECVIINQPLYHYVRWNTQSLMSRFGSDNPDEALSRLCQLRDFCGSQDETVIAAFEKSAHNLKQNYIHRTMQSKDLTKEQKMALIRRLEGENRAGTTYLRQHLIMGKRLVRKVISYAVSIASRVWSRIKRMKFDFTLRSIRKRLKTDQFTIIAQNCIGGVFYHDMGLPFQTPTVNLFFYAPDYVKFVSNLPHYLSCELKMRWGEDYPLGQLDDLTVHFMHYDSCTEAKATWERRKQRIHFDKLLVIGTDRNGFSEDVFEAWKKIPYPKLLFTANPKHMEDPDSLLFPQYTADGCVPNLIPKREFYKNNALLNAVNRLEKGDA